MAFLQMIFERLSENDGNLSAGVTVGDVSQDLTDPQVTELAEAIMASDYIQNDIARGGAPAGGWAMNSEWEITSLTMMGVTRTIS